MRKKLRKCFAVLLCIAMIGGTSSIVMADGLDDLGKEVDGSLLTLDNSSEKVIKTLVRGNILNQGTARITNNEDGTVNIFGAVFGSVKCDKMIVNITLQRYSNGTWYNMGTYGDTAYNTTSMSRSYNVPVTAGYYYRAKAACVAQKGSTTESQMPITNGIWVG